MWVSRDNSQNGWPDEPDMCEIWKIKPKGSDGNFNTLFSSLAPDDLMYVTEFKKIYGFTPKKGRVTKMEEIK